MISGHLTILFVMPNYVQCPLARDTLVRSRLSRGVVAPQTPNDSPAVMA